MKSHMLTLAGICQVTAYTDNKWQTLCSRYRSVFMIKTTKPSDQLKIDIWHQSSPALTSCAESCHCLCSNKLLVILLNWLSLTLHSSVSTQGQKDFLDKCWKLAEWTFQMRKLKNVKKTLTPLLLLYLSNCVSECIEALLKLLLSLYWQ